MNNRVAFRLSICIGTFNRAAFIGATLDSIISQLTSDCEIIVLDNASTDDTKQVVMERARRIDHLRYIRQDSNRGMDRNYDCAVVLARGEYCWLMSDDDLIKPGALARILKALARDLSLIIVNEEIRDFSMSKVVQRTVLDFESDRIYGREEMDRLFVEVGWDLIVYIGAYVVKREIWVARERECYYGSHFIHVGIVFQERLPGDALVIAEPLVSYRLGNAHSFSSNVIDIVFSKWPSLVESFAVSESAKRKMRAEPWRSTGWLLVLRGLALYSLAEYRQWIHPRLDSIHEKLAPILVALLPGILANSLLILYYFARRDRGHYLLAMRQSPFHIRNWWMRKRIQ